MNLNTPNYTLPHPTNPNSMRATHKRHNYIQHNMVIIIQCGYLKLARPFQRYPRTSNFTYHQYAHMSHAYSIRPFPRGDSLLGIHGTLPTAESRLGELTRGLSHRKQMVTFLWQKVTKYPKIRCTIWERCQGGGIKKHQRVRSITCKHQSTKNLRGAIWRLGQGTRGDVKKSASSRCSKGICERVCIHVIQERLVQAIRGLLLGFRRGDSVISKTRAIGKQSA